MGRPLTGHAKRVKFTTTVDPDIIARARTIATQQNITLPQLIEQLLKNELARESSEKRAEAADMAALLRLRETPRRLRRQAGD